MMLQVDNYSTMSKKQLIQTLKRIDSLKGSKDVRKVIVTDKGLMTYTIEGKFLSKLVF